MINQNLAFTRRLKSLRFKQLIIYFSSVSKWNLITAAASGDQPLAWIGIVVLLISAVLTAMYLFSVVIKAFYKQASEPDSAYTVLGSFAVDDKISAKELKTKRYTVEKSGLTPDAYTVKIVRETAESTDNAIIDTCYVGSVRAIKSVSPVSAERCRQITLIGLKIKASEKLSNYIDQLNFVSQSKLPVCSGTSSGPSSWNGTALSSNPASAAMYAMRGDVVQQKLADTDIDWISFRELYQWCAEHGYECNAYITDSMPISELLANIGSTCRAEISRQNGKIRVIHDIVRSGFVQLFTPRNSSNYSESILFADIPDELVLSFPDEKSGYAENELKVFNTPDGNRRQIPDTSQDMPVWGVTSDVQARKLAMFNLAVSRARPIVHTFNADFEYMLCQKGDWIKYAGDIALAGIAQGRIVSLITDRGILIGAVTDEAITTEPGKTYGVRIRRSDGTCILEEIVTTGGTGNQFDFVRPIPADYAEPGNLFTFGEYDRDSIDLIVTDIRCGDDLTAEITAVGYAPEIFAVDEPDFVLPDYTNQLSEFASAVDAGTVENAISASTSALNAKISEIRASKSATSASASATTAGAKASEASTSATSASESATSAKTSESNAATSAANAKKDADFVRDFDANWDERVSNTKVNGHTLIEGGYINTDIIEADSITADKLNVLVKNKINNFSESGNAEGWDLSNPGVVFDSADRAIVATRQTGSAPNFYSAPFSVNPHDILKFDFDLQTIGSVSPSPNEGLYLGLTYGNKFNVYKWSKTDKCWVLNQTGTNCYFVNDFRTLIPVHFTTYIIGKAVDINSVPAGSVSSELNFYCLQLIDRTITTLRTGYNSGPAGTAWKFSNPVITDVSGGTIIGPNIMAGSINAEQINVDSLVVKTAKSSNFSQELVNKNGFFMDGEHNIEYHYGDAIYDSKYIKNSDLSPCVSFGPNSGFSNRFKGDWDNSKIYYANDVVLYYNEYYVALGYIEANLQVTPKTSPFWSDMQADAPNSTAIGGNSLTSVTTGNFNTAIGANTLRRLTTGSSNVAVGRDALYNLETGLRNVAVGDLALSSCDKSACFNVAIGNNALCDNKGSLNVAIGSSAGSPVGSVQPGSNNVFVGNGIYDRGGNNRILIGGNINPNFFTWSTDNYINLNDRILCFEFPKGTKKGDIYKRLTIFLSPYTTSSGKARAWVGAMGFVGHKMVTQIGYKTSTSILRFYDHLDNNVFEALNSSDTSLTQEDIAVCFINNNNPVGG